MDPLALPEARMLPAIWGWTFTGEVAGADGASEALARGVEPQLGRPGGVVRPAVAGYRGAVGDVERELGQGAAAPATRVAGRGQAGHRVPAGDQDHHGPVPRGRGRGARLRGGGARRGPVERRGPAVHRRPGT